MSSKATTCPSEQVLADFGLGKLERSASDTVHQHLETCIDCRSFVAGLSGDSFVDRLRDAQKQSAGNPAPPRTGTLLSGESISNAHRHSDTSLADGPGPVPGKPAAAAGSAAKPPANIPPGLAEHPDYEILRELGRGGMGVVYLARNRMMDRLEVLKVVSKALLDRPGALERFQQEIRSAARLAHPNIVAAYSVLRPGELLVFCMEYVEGHDLAQVVKQRGALPVVNAAFYAHQVALGLQHAFEKGMVHRDIKPNNLMLAVINKKHVVKILDFGLAKATSEKGADSGLTKSGQMLGTPDYIAPEQTLDAQKADIRADIYSLGCTLYYMLAGHPPFSGNSLYEVLHAHHHTEAEPLNLLRPEVPAELAAVVARMLAKDPAHRYQAPGEVAKALGPFFKAGGAPVLPSAVSGQGPGTTSAAPRSATPIAVAPIAPGVSPAAAVAAPIPLVMPVALSPAQAAPVAVAASIAPLDFSLELVEASRRPPRRAERRRGRRGWLLGSFSAVVAATIVAAVLLRFRTQEGIIAIEASEPYPEVFIDGTKALVAWDTSGTKAEISLLPGTRKVELKKDGFRLTGETVELARGGRHLLTARLEPLPAAADGKRQTTVTSTSDPAPAKPGPSSVADHVEPLKTIPTNWVRTGERPWLTFVNRRTDTVELIWLRHGGVRTSYGKIGPGGTNHQHTFSGDIFLIVGPDGKNVAAFQAPSHSATAVITPDLTLDSGKWNDSQQSISEPRNSRSQQPEGFVSLFNGRDLSGWKTHSSQPGNWIVRDGHILARCPDVSHLYTERGDYRDVHVRMRAKLAPHSGGGLIVRSSFGSVDFPPWPDGYETQLETLTGKISGRNAFRPLAGSGTILINGKVFGQSAMTNIQPEKWFTLEIVAVDNRMTALVDGIEVSSYVDRERQFASGHIAVQCDFSSTLEIESIEVKDLTGVASGGSLAPAAATQSHSITPPPSVPPAKGAYQWPPGTPAPAIAPFDAKQARAHQEAWAKHLGVPVEETNSIGMKLVLIPPGEFMMGSTPEQIELATVIKNNSALDKRLEAETPAHRVQISRSYRIGATEVTIGQFKQFADAAGYVGELEPPGAVQKYDPKLKKYAPTSENWRNPGYTVTDDTALSYVTRNDAVAFCNWVSARERRTPCYISKAGQWVLHAGGDGYRLPTEAEWELACRAGTTTLYSFGDSEKELSQYGWFTSNTWIGAARVGLKRQNAFGLFDMHGNVAEWCNDRFDATYYAASVPVDPDGPSSGDAFAIRGGSHTFPAYMTRSAFRTATSRLSSSSITGRYGFRVFRGASQDGAPGRSAARAVESPSAGAKSLPAAKMSDAAAGRPASSTVAKKNYDIDGDGRLDANEFRVALRAFDANGDGTLDADERRAMSDALRPSSGSTSKPTR